MSRKNLHWMILTLLLIPTVLRGKEIMSSSLQESNFHIYLILSAALLIFTFFIFLYFQTKKRKIKKRELDLLHESEMLSNQINALRFDSEKLISDKKEQLKKELSDIKTNINALETALKTSNESAVRNSVLLSNISYTLRTNLNDIMGFSTLLENEFAQQEEEELYEYSENIRKSGQTLLHLLNNMIDISKIEAKKFNITRQNCNLDNLIQDVITVFEPSASQKGLKISYQPEPLPVFSTDLEALKHILSNLLDNAAKYTEKGFIKISHKIENNQVYITIKDTGVGIDKAFLDDIFEPFGQVQPGYSKSGYKGAGLGLPLVRQMLELMDGALDFQSEKAVGTIVTISLPLAPPLENVKKLKTQTDKSQLEKVVPELQKTIDSMLIVDSDYLNRMLIKKMVPQVGVIQQVINENELDDVFEKHSDKFPWDVVLLDSDLEDLDYGIGLKKKYATQYPGLEKIPFIAMLSVPDKVKERKCLSEGFSSCLEKPITKEKLITLLNQTLA